ncbi:MAG: CPBP family intramembrane metalloprotease [Lachnospiraceae bacterium]|nr:CPBP family intramembrane metalloprotease [Lachnospiraceae bacterium]
MEEVRKANNFTLIVLIFLQVGALGAYAFILSVIASIARIMNKVDNLGKFYLELAGNNAGTLIMTQSFILIGVLIYLIAFKGWKIVPFKLLGPVNLILLVLLSICVRYLATFIDMVSLLFTKPLAAMSTVKIDEVLPFWAAVILITIAPAIGEELFCRGILYGSYRKISISNGVIVSALIFGFLHGNFNQFIYTTFLGIILALAVEITDSILASMFIHFLFNSFAVFILYGTQLTKKYNLNVDLSSLDIEASKVTVDGIILYVQENWWALVGAAIGTVVILSILALVNGKNLFRLSAKYKDTEVTEEPETTETVEVTEEPETTETVEVTEEPETTETVEVTEEAETAEAVAVRKYPEKERIVTASLAIAMVFQFFVMVIVEIMIYIKE